MAGTFNTLNAHLLWTREAYSDARLPVARQHRLQGLKQASSPADPSAKKGLPEGLGVGDPDHIVAVIKRWESIGVDGINFLLNAGELVTQEQVLESLRLFAREVMPKFAGAQSDRVYAPTTLPAGLS